MALWWGLRPDPQIRRSAFQINSSIKLRKSCASPSCGWWRWRGPSHRATGSGNIGGHVAMRPGHGQDGARTGPARGRTGLAADDANLRDGGGQRPVAACRDLLPSRQYRLAPWCLKSCSARAVPSSAAACKCCSWRCRQPKIDVDHGLLNAQPRPYIVAGEAFTARCRTRAWGGFV
jgi:hypothetical protein